MSTVREMAALAGIREATVRDWIARGEVQAVRGPVRGAYDVDVDSVRAHLQWLQRRGCQDCGAILEAKIQRGRRRKVCAKCRLRRGREWNRDPGRQAREQARKRRVRDQARKSSQ